MTRTVMPSIKQPWQVIIAEFEKDFTVAIWHRNRMKAVYRFDTRAAAENWAHEKAQEMRIIKHGEARS